MTRRHTKDAIDYASWRIESGSDATRQKREAKYTRIAQAVRSGAKYSEIAAALKVSRSRVSQMILKARRINARRTHTKE